MYTYVYMHTKYIHIRNKIRLLLSVLIANDFFDNYLHLKRAT